jgi:hypothetical protein
VFRKVRSILLTYKKAKGIKGAKWLLPKFVEKGCVHVFDVIGFVATPSDAKLALF